jgi:hypothetical protein
MNPNVKESESTTVSGFDIVSDAPLVKLGASDSTDETAEQLKQILARVLDLLGSAPAYLSEFVDKYRQPLVYAGIIFTSVVSVKLTLAMLSAVNEIPLMAPLFELIGIAYTIWFGLRYLLKADGRADFKGEVKTIKDQILGAKK